jgi:hypothetical protein
MDAAVSKLDVAGHPEVVQALETALAMARAGKICGVAIVVTAGASHYDVSLAGRHPLELHYGLGKLSRLVEQQLDGGGARSPILRPVGRA